MCEHSVLGSIDPQIGQYPAASVLRAVIAKPVTQVDDETLILADVAERALAQVERAVSGLLVRHMDGQKTAQMAVA